MYYNIFLDISQLSPPATWSSSKNSQTYVGWYTLSPRHCESHLNIVTLLPLTSCLWMALLSTSSVGSFCSVGEDSIFSFFSVFLVSFFTLGLDIWSKSAPLSFIFNISNLVWLHLFWFVFNRTVIYLEYQRLVYASPLAQLSTFCTKMSVCFRGQVEQFYDNYDNNLAVDLTIKVGPLYRHWQIVPPHTQRPV